MPRRSLAGARRRPSALPKDCRIAAPAPVRQNPARCRSSNCLTRQQKNDDGDEEFAMFAGERPARWPQNPGARLTDSRPLGPDRAAESHSVPTCRFGSRSCCLAANARPINRKARSPKFRSTTSVTPRSSTPGARTWALQCTDAAIAGRRPERATAFNSRALTGARGGRSQRVRFQAAKSTGSDRTRGGKTCRLRSIPPRLRSMCPARSPGYHRGQPTPASSTRRGAAESRCPIQAVSGWMLAP
jgi:hypothetical protein